MRIVRVDDDAGVHACRGAPALGRAVGVPIRHQPILGRLGKRGETGLERLAPNAVWGRKARKRGGGEERRV